MWREAHSHERLLAGMYCPPSEEDLMTVVAAYFPFNEGSQVQASYKPLTLCRRCMTSDCELQGRRV
eukprot:4481739-Pyramimonas_sp.AAC.2